LIKKRAVGTDRNQSTWVDTEDASFCNFIGGVVLAHEFYVLLFLFAFLYIFIYFSIIFFVSGIREYH
jgi:hypothetical protein